MTLLTQIILNSFICYGVYFATRYEYSLIEQAVTRNEILGFIKKYGDLFLPKWIRKPLYDCPMCMASFWSIMSAFYFGLEVMTDIVPVIFATCGLNYIIQKLSPYND